MALQFLFQYDSGSLPPREEYVQNLRREANNAEVAKFAQELIDGTIERWDAITKEIEQVSRNWSVERMSTSDRNVLRLAIYELLWRDDIPAKVAINEAIELAKRFGTEQSGSFVNGILDQISKKATKKG